MFYHFKGTITGEDYQRILGQMTKRMMLVFSGIMLIFLVINFVFKNIFTKKAIAVANNIPLIP